MRTSKQAPAESARFIRVLVASHTPTLDARLKALLQSHPELQLAGTEPLSTALAERVDALHPDVLLIFLGPQEQETRNVDSLLDRLAGLIPACVMLTGAIESVSFDWRGGGKAILPQQATVEEIAAAIQAVVAGLTVIHPALEEILAPRSRPASARTRPAFPRALLAEPLTPREISVLGMLAEGLSNKEVAMRLSISEHTAKFHISSILGKLGASSRTEAVMLGLRQGLLML